MILTRVDFDKDQKPRLKIGDPKTGTITSFTPEFNKPITIKINLNQRHCIGWHNLETGEDFTCPESAEVEQKYEQCQKCQKRTGFNPAFYNAAPNDISEQQAKRNSEPHFVYLAYFSDSVIKVGISFCGRQQARLLEQGARAALILGNFPSANVARNYEFKISQMSNFVENVKSNLKLKLLEQPFSFEKATSKLLEAKNKIEQALQVKFDDNPPLNLSQFYSNEMIPYGEIIEASSCAQNNELVFSGVLKAQVGYILLAENDGELVAIPLRQYTGFDIEISDKVEKMNFPERQASLFNF